MNRPTYHLVLAPTFTRAAFAGFRTNGHYYVATPRTLKRLDPSIRFDGLTIIGDPGLTAAQAHQIEGHFNWGDTSDAYSDRIWDCVYQ